MKSLKRNTEIKNLLRDFRKFYINDFREFEKKQNKKGDSYKNAQFINKIKEYLLSERMKEVFGSPTSDEQSYSLALIINPKLTIN
mmetsp:Transcript_23618/g.20986  ORF Transcript_23618/g.20986 Transcript_23618/m.20986 type:complete len:85 (-) Transcript_23618:201-455(-)